MLTCDLFAVYNLEYTVIFVITSATVDRFSYFFSVKFRKDLRRKVELKLPLPLKSVAALPSLSGKKQRGRPKTTWSGNIIQWTDMDLERVLRVTTDDRCQWTRTIYGAVNPRIEDDWSQSQSQTTLRNVNGQLYTFAFILARIICFMLGGVCFTSFYSFIFFLPDTDVIMTLVQYNLFVALLIPFSYEEKRLAQHWTTYNWHIHWPVAFTIENTHMCRRRTF